MKYILKLAYKGTDYHGWQIQKNANSVQAMIEKAFHLLCGERVELTGCGRTDTGVHASCYFAHFETEAQLSENFVYKLNSILPKDIAISLCTSIVDEFHARFSAISREYKYLIHSQKDPFLNDESYFFHHELNLEMMNRACEVLKATKDFASFCKKGGDNKTTRCEIYECFWLKEGYQLVFTIRADRFLRNMVRAIVGTMLEIGLNKMNLDELETIIESKNRSLSGTSVPACGLYLTEITYPKEFNLD